MGGYTSNPTVSVDTEDRFHHSIGGMAEDGTTVAFAAKNDYGYDWWTINGKLVLEDPEYRANMAFAVGSWIEMLSKYACFVWNVAAGNRWRRHLPPDRGHSTAIFQEKGQAVGNRVASGGALYVECLLPAAWRT